MPMISRAVEWDCPPPKPLEHFAACVSCGAEGPAVVLGPNLNVWQIGRIEAAEEAKRAGWKEVRDVSGGHFAEHICPKCAGGLL